MLETIKKIIRRFCIFLVTVIIGYTALNVPYLNKNPKIKDFEKYNKSLSIPNIELNKISDHELYVHGRVIQFENVSDDVLKWYAEQIEYCPDYLLETVDEIRIVPYQTLLNIQNDVNDNVLAIHQHTGTISTIILGDWVTEDKNIFLHEAVHAYDVQYNITESPAFINIYETEGQNYDARAKDIKEYFAYSYVDYLTLNIDSERYPSTTEFYESLNTKFI